MPANATTRRTCCQPASLPACSQYTYAWTIHGKQQLQQLVLPPPSMQIYNRRLDERAQRRQFVLDRGLLNIKRQQVCVWPLLCHGGVTSVGA